MAQVIIEKEFDKEPIASTKKCYLCKALFPIEYKDCPRCSMFR
ncbi:MAG: hypothetical protein ACO2Y5_06935 [Nitrosopumilaceae archaeon]